MQTAVMETVGVENGADPTHNLNHIYFFLEQTALSGHMPTPQRDDIGVTPTEDALRTPKSRDSSPGSTGTGSSTTLTGSASTTSTNLNPHAAFFSPSASFSPQDVRSSPTTSTTTPLHSTTAPLHSATGDMYKLCEIPGKGVGLVATAFIPRSTRIISERPLMKIPQNLVQLAWGSYCKLNKWKKDAFNKLHAYTPENLCLENTSRVCLIDYSMKGMEDEDAVDKLVAEQVRVMSIFSVNNFNLTPTGLAVYATTSRLNHSCAPNTYHGFNPNIDRFTVHAVRDIEPGEELTINYMGAPADFMVRTQRLEHLRTYYGFTCTCSSCSDWTSASDTRRELLNNICWGLGEYEEGAPPTHPFIPEGSAQAFKFAVDAVKFMISEGLLTMGLLKASHAASKHALVLEDWHSAVQYALRESEVEHGCLGEDVQDLVKDGAAASCWIKHVRSTIIQSLGLEQAMTVFEEYDGEPAMREARRAELEDEQMKVQKAKKKAQRAKLARKARERRAMAKTNQENGVPDAGNAMSPKDTEKQVESKSWAKVVAGGGVQASPKSEGWPALEKENGGEKDVGW